MLLVAYLLWRFIGKPLFLNVSETIDGEEDESIAGKKFTLDERREKLAKKQANIEVTETLTGVTSDLASKQNELNKATTKLSAAEKKIED